jgi:hypothetical protein
MVPRMRRPLALVLAVPLLFCLSRGAAAIELPFTGTLTLQIIYFDPLPRLDIHGGGIANAVGGANDVLSAVEFPKDAFVTSDHLIPVTDDGQFPIAGIKVDLANDTGTFGGGEGSFGGPMPLRGVTKVCLFGTCSVAVANLSLPMSVVGHDATAVASGAINLTVSGAPWTTGTVQLQPISGNPAESIAGSRQTGVLNLVTPVFISTNIASASVVNAWARLLMQFSPPEGSYCDNDFDDDGDGFADFPADPGCESAADPSERQEGAPCDDGLDNDGDQRKDGSDPGCDGPLDGSERTTLIACDDGFDNDGDAVGDFPTDPGCASPSDPSERGSLACDDDADTDGDGFADFPADPGCESATDDSERGPGRVCDDGADDDGDGNADFPGDAGCASIDDPSERSAAFVCDNMADEDGDEVSDYPFDPGCSSALDSSERNPLLACDDALDNDFDGAKDFPGDPGCYGPADTTELSVGGCDNGLDDDGDVLIDSQQDPGCTGPGDPREELDFSDGGLHQIDAEHPSLDHSVFVTPAAGGILTRLVISDGGEVSGDLYVVGKAHLDMSGGSIGGDLKAAGLAFVVIRGGSIGGSIAALEVWTVIEIHGTSFDMPFGDVLASSGTITGFLDDGSAIAVPFTRGLGATIRLVPEPGATLAGVAALAMLLLLRARRSPA